MKQSKKLLALVMALLMIASLAACGQAAAPAAAPAEAAPADAAPTDAAPADAAPEEPADDGSLLGVASAETHLTVGTSTAPNGHYVMGLLEMQRLLEEYSGGTMTLDIYPNSALGGERDMIENVGIGAQDMVLSSTGPIGNFVPDFTSLDMPYLFQNAEEAYEVLDSEIGAGLLEQLAGVGVVGLGFWENGFRHTTNAVRELVHPSDLKGLKIRTMENNVHMATYEAFGATATPMAWGEIFTALQQKTVDGQENPLAIIASSGVYEAQAYLSLNYVFYSPCVLMISQSIWDGLSEEQQGWITKAADEAKAYQRDFSQSSADADRATIEGAGVTVTEVDVAEWAAAAAGIYDRMAELNVNADLVGQIQAMLGR